MMDSKVINIMSTRERNRASTTEMIDLKSVNASKKRQRCFFINKIFFILLIPIYTFTWITYFLFLQRTNITDEDMLLLPPDERSSISKEKIRRNEESLNFPPKPRGGVMSVCLLIKDENNNLPEWIAYHYHTLPLRHLVVAIDPNSMTSPMDILKQWNNTFGMEITVWNDSDYLPKGIQGPLPWNATKSHVPIHRKRQRWFYQKCIKYLHARKRTWTAFIDADEYIVFNSVNDQDNKTLFRKIRSIPETNRSSYKANDVTEELYYDIKKHFGEKAFLKGKLEAFKKAIQARTRLGNKVGSITVAQFISKENFNVPWNRPCVLMPRVTYGNEEEINQTLLHASVPKGFIPKKFNTLRFFRNSYKGIQDKANAPGKSFIDVSRLSKFTLTRNMSLCVHAIVLECQEFDKHIGYALLEDSLLRVNHYSLPREIFFTKSDKRRTIKMYEERAQANDSINYDLQPWLMSFVKEVGHERAKIILKDAGKVGEWKHPEDIRDTSLS